MALDQPYVDAIKQSEGFSPQASWDYKQNSNGYGTKAQYPGEVIDQATAEQRFNDELAKAEAHVNSVAPNAPPGVKAALTSLTYNAGPGWSQSGLGDLVRAGDWQGASDRFQQYNKAGGQVNAGLTTRRQKEAAWFNQAPAGESAPVQTASAAPMQIAPMGGAPAPVQSQPSAPLDLSSFRQAAYSPPSGMPAFPWSPGQQTPYAHGVDAPNAQAQFQPMLQAPQINYYRPQLASASPRRGFAFKG